jgi:hypothetical protein
MRCRLLAPFRRPSQHNLNQALHTAAGILIAIVAVEGVWQRKGSKWAICYSKQINQCVALPKLAKCKR